MIGLSNYYKILNISEKASFFDIKTAYWNVCESLKVEIQKGIPAFVEKVNELNNAYEVLSDREARQAYDRELQMFQDTPSDGAITNEVPDYYLDNFDQQQQVEFIRWLNDYAYTYNTLWEKVSNCRNKKYSNQDWLLIKRIIKKVKKFYNNAENELKFLPFKGEVAQK